ncbi:MAG: TPM domain-containing protein [Planctomycetes bacterium]|nr:TPM domain-containing protein [Planctomycetota bacterium]
MYRAAKLIVCWWSVLAGGLAGPGSVLALHLELERPGDREFVRDLADLITPEDEQEIRRIGDRLLSEKVTPIVVVTIRSMAEHGGEDLRIETFARLLFDQWRIGIPEINRRQWNTGVLLLVSEGDRRARLELGAGWGREKDGLCQQIMDEQIIARFKQGQFSEGIFHGVKALDHMARGLQLPGRPLFWWHYALGAGLLGLLIFTGISVMRSGSKGWAWIFWGALFAFLGYVLYQIATSKGGGGRSYSGGSFGGGYSGGGGASGSW